MKKVFSDSHYKHLFGFVPENDGFDKMSIDIFPMDAEQSEFYNLVFTADPITGNPTSDVQYMLSGADEGFKAYIKEHLMSPIPTGSLADNPDEAIELCKPNMVTSDQYQEFLNDYVRRLYADNN